MGPVGGITTQVTFDKPLYQGPRDPIIGQVQLTFRPYGTPSSAVLELFAPLRLTIILQGCIKLHAAENRTSHAYIFFNETRLLFRRSQLIFDGSLRATAGDVRSFPFRICFPSRLDVAQGEYGPLPPSVNLRMEAVAARQYGKHQGSASVEYSLRVQAEMPGIDVVLNESVPFSVQYEQPSRTLQPTLSGEASKTFRVESFELLGEEERPNGLLGKTKATLRNVTKPVYSFTATLFGVPTVLAIGQALRMGVRVKTEDAATTTTVGPAVTISKCKAGLIADTSLYVTDERRGNSPNLTSSTSLIALAMINQDPKGPFTKTSDNMKPLVFESLPGDIPSTFSTKKLTRSYRLRLEIEFAVAGQVMGMTKDYPTEILPPLQGSLLEPPPAADGVAEAGPSREYVEEMLPTYQETVASR